MLDCRRAPHDRRQLIQAMTMERHTHRNDGRFLNPSNDKSSHLNS